MNEKLAKGLSGFGTNVFIVIVGILLLYGLVFGGQWLYSKVDPTVFPDAVEVTELTDENDKAVAMINAITHQMRYEMDSVFGWTANDLLFNPYVLDNRAYRQLGVYTATKVFIEHYSLVIARLGNNDNEDTILKRVRENYFSLAPTAWGVLGIWAAAEGYYENGFKGINQYIEGLSSGASKYNFKSDDMVASLEEVASNKVLGYALGLLEDSNNKPFYQVDNDIYVAQGVALVVRDFMKAMYTLYPMEIKNNEANYNYLMNQLDLICTFDPIWMAANPFNSGALVRSYLLNAQSRVMDIRNSVAK